MGGGTEAFPDLGKHCQLEDCKQLDFLPFSCDGCKKVFCLEHRSYKSHNCRNPDEKSRKVFVCETCSTSFETTGLDKNVVETMIVKHQSSGNCDPKKKKKPRCPVKRCREVLTFSNNWTCQTCKLKVCLNHRFAADHECNKGVAAAVATAIAGFDLRKGKDCGNSDKRASPPNRHSIKAF